MMMQNFSTPASRNPVKAAGAPISSKVPVPKGGRPDASTTSSGAGKAPHAPGSSVTGFSGTGMKPGKIR
jgi:hypothetical protein